MTDTPGGLDPLLRKAEVLRIVKVHESTLDEWIKDQRFPAPLVMNPGQGREIVGWLTSDIQRWFDSRPRRQARAISQKAYAATRGKKRKPAISENNEKPAKPEPPIKRPEK